MAWVLDLARCDTADTSLVGGKARGLGGLIRHDFPVPTGFVVTADAYRHCVEAAGLPERVAAILGEEGSGAEGARRASGRIAALFTASVLDAEVGEQITAAYAELGEAGAAPVAVRSSATAEDLADASFAGQQDTYLWICGEAAVREHVVRCWASLFTMSAIQYRARLGVELEGLAMGVVVQRMVPAEAAGVMMTLEPVGGDRSKVYIEAALGLGEGVVRGDVGVDRFTVAKDGLRTLEEHVGHKAQAHRVDLATRKVGLTDVDDAQRDVACLSAGELRDVAGLGVRVEQAFGRPMDIEWAVEGEPGARHVQLVQARPETVWSRREPAADARAAADVADPLHERSAPGLHWTTTNVGEAMPGVLTPLSWSLWRPTGVALREVAHAIGAMSAAERRAPETEGAALLSIFRGRAAFQLEFFSMLGDRLPGTTGAEAAATLMGRVPDDIAFHPTRRRYPFVALRLPWAFTSTPRRVRAAEASTAEWYAGSLAALPELERAAATAKLGEAGELLVEMVTLQALAVFSVVQPMHDAVERVVQKAGTGDVGTLAGAGGAEMLGVVGDLWKVSRGELDLDAVVARHGFHGPMEGELSSRVWREDRSALERLVGDYAARPDSEDPVRREAARAAQAAALRPQILAAVPAVQRPLVRLLLRMAARRLPLRGVAKVFLLQAFDVARAAARRIGACLVEEGVLDDPEDVFFLTAAELRGPLPADARAVVAARRRQRAEHLAVELPSDWTGEPEAVPAGTGATTGDGSVMGIGVSAGIVEGRARVLAHPGEELEPDEVLVAPTTDPSWSSIMFVSSALVVDIGGALSHAAVVARELGIPCVVNTRTGTRVLRTGDRVRVDGSTGVVEVLERA